jgi:hypothetical protein
MASRSMKGVVDRIALFFKGGCQWLTAAPRYRGAVLCGLCLIGAIIAIGHNGSKGIFAPVTQTSDVVAARMAAMSAESGTRSARNSLPKNGIGDADVESSPVDNDSQGGKEGPSAKTVASDKSFLVAETEKKKTRSRDKSEGKKTATKPAKKTQRRVSSERDRKFSPTPEIKRAEEKITSIIRDLF